MMAGDLDLTEAIEAGKRAYLNAHTVSDAKAIRAAIEAAAPIIERQVREQIAAEIEARIKPPSDRPIRDTEGALTAAVTVALQQGMRSAVRIARGES